MDSIYIEYKHEPLHSDPLMAAALHRNRSVYAHNAVEPLHPNEIQRSVEPIHVRLVSSDRYYEVRPPRKVVGFIDGIKAHCKGRWHEPTNTWTVHRQHREWLLKLLAEFFVDSPILEEKRADNTPALPTLPLPALAEQYLESAPMPKVALDSFRFENRRDDAVYTDKFTNPEMAARERERNNAILIKRKPQGETYGGIDI